MLNAKKGLSAKQMQRDLGAGYQTAWYLCHRIRKAMEVGELPKFTGFVEVDETYDGGRYDRRRKRQPWEKAPVMGIVEREGASRRNTFRPPARPCWSAKSKTESHPKARSWSQMNWPPTNPWARLTATRSSITCSNTCAESSTQTRLETSRACSSAAS